MASLHSNNALGNSSLLNGCVEQNCTTHENHAPQHCPVDEKELCCLLNHRVVKLCDAGLVLDLTSREWVGAAEGSCEALAPHAYSIALTTSCNRKSSSGSQQLPGNWGRWSPRWPGVALSVPRLGRDCRGTVSHKHKLYKMPNRFC